jgi:hypothetical protein
VALVASGCQVLSPLQTAQPYRPADGTPAMVGQLAVRGLVLVGDGSGPAVVSGNASNLGNQPMTVKLEAQPSATEPAGAAPSGGSEIQLAPHEQVNLATKGLQLSGVKAVPGSLVPVSVTSSTGGTTLVSVPLLPAVEYYSTLTPTGDASTAPATPTSPATPTETPSTPAPTTS